MYVDGRPTTGLSNNGIRAVQKATQVARAASGFEKQTDPAQTGEPRTVEETEALKLYDQQFRQYLNIAIKEGLSQTDSAALIAIRSSHS